MITYDVKPRSDGTYDFSFKGLSTDTKPTGSHDNMAISGSSTFFEKDTQEVFFYDTDDWLPQP